MRSADERGFRNRATQLMAANETVIIKRHGVPIGFFVPTAARGRQAGREALDRLGELVEDLLEQTGLDEDSLVREVEAAGPCTDAPS